MLTKQESKIVEMYKKGTNGPGIAKELEIPIGKIYTVLKKADVERRVNGSNWKKYTANYSYFETIDSERKAYWLGFITADGYVTTDRNQFGLTLAKTDKTHIEKLVKDMDATHEVKDYVHDTAYKKKTEYSRLIITSTKLKEDLISHGIVPNKTFETKIPDLRSDLIQHFIRGYFDGDGSITKYTPKSTVDSKTKLTTQYQLKICGTKEILKEILYHFNLSSHTLFERNYDDKNNFYISIGGNDQVLTALEYIYKDSTIYLERKYSRYQELLTQQSSK